MLFLGVIEKVIAQRKETGERPNDIIDFVLDEMKSNSLSEDFTPEEKELIMLSNALVMFFTGFDSTAISTRTAPGHPKQSLAGD